MAKMASSDLHGKMLPLGSATVLPCDRVEALKLWIVGLWRFHLYIKKKKKKTSKCKEIMSIGVHKHHKSEERAPSPLQQQYQAVTLVNKAQIQHTSQVWS